MTNKALGRYISIEASGLGNVSDRTEKLTASLRSTAVK